MSYLARYGEAMDYLRNEFNLPVSISMYEAVVRVVDEYRLIKENKSSKGEETCQTTTNQEKSKNKKHLKSQSKRKKEK